MRVSGRVVGRTLISGAVCLLAAGCGSSGTGSQVLDLASKCSAATSAGADSGSGLQSCMTIGTPGGEGQDPSSAAVGVADKMLPLCTQLGPKLQGVTPDGLSTFTGAVVGATRANVSFARCTTASGSRFFFLTITHGGTPSSAGGAPQKLSDGSTLYVQPEESGDFCARYYPDGWSVGFSAEVEAPNFEPDCHSATAVVHAWLTGS